jgi:hypothetical protein
MFCNSTNKVKAATIAPCTIIETLLKKKKPFEDGNMIKEWQVIHYLVNLKIKLKYAMQLTRLRSWGTVSRTAECMSSDMKNNWARI